jgi:hypothetical protein
MRRLQADRVHPTYELPEAALLIKSSNGPVMVGAGGGGTCRALSSPVLADLFFFVVRLPMNIQRLYDYCSERSDMRWVYITALRKYSIV